MSRCPQLYWQTLPHLPSCKKTMEKCVKQSWGIIKMIMCILWISDSLTLLREVSSGSITILGFKVVKVEKSVGVIFFFSESSVSDTFFFLFEISPRYVVHFFKLSFWERIEHIRHPFSLNRADWMVHTSSTHWKRFPTKLISQSFKRAQYLIVR